MGSFPSAHRPIAPNAGRNSDGPPIPRPPRRKVIVGHEREEALVRSTQAKPNRITPSSRNASPTGAAHHQDCKTRRTRTVPEPPIAPEADPTSRMRKPPQRKWAPIPRPSRHQPTRDAASCTSRRRRSYSLHNQEKHASLSPCGNTSRTSPMCKPNCAARPTHTAPKPLKSSISDPQSRTRKPLSIHAQAYRS